MSHLSTNQETIAAILYKQACKEPLTDNEVQLMADWRNASLENRQVVETISDDDELLRSIKELYSFDKEEIWQKLTQRRHAIRPPRRVQLLKTTWVRYAAAIIMVAGAVAYFYYASHRKKEGSVVVNPVPVNKDIAPGREGAILTLADGKTMVLDSMNNGHVAIQNGSDLTLQNGQLVYNSKDEANTTVVYNTMSALKGRQFRLLLSDGSKIWLNTESSITYPTVFTGNERRVKITGEVYFEVAKDKSKPFMVDIDGRGTVEVLGTHFAINSYANEDAIKTTLLEGKVKVSATQPETANPKPVTLNPGEQAIITDHITVTNQINIDQVMAWKNGFFDFNGQDLRAVMRQLERWYDIKVKYQESFKNDIFRGRIVRTVNLSEVLDILQEVSSARFKIEDKTLIVL